MLFYWLREVLYKVLVFEFDFVEKKNNAMCHSQKIGKSMLDYI